MSFNIIPVSSGSAVLINGIDSDALLEQLAAKIIPQAAKIVPFSHSNHLDQRVIDASRRLNPNHALFNCTVMAYSTAYLLEKGELPKLPLTCPNMPRPNLKKWWPHLFQDLDPCRTYVQVGNLNKRDLDRLMTDLGPGTHGLLLARRSDLIGKMGVGHAFNYLLNEEDNQTKFVILDSYSKSYHDKGLQRPEQFLATYQDQFDALLFFDKTPKNQRLISSLNSNH